MAGGRDEEGGIQDGKRAEEEYHLCRRAKHRRIHLAECAHHLLALRIEPGAAQDGGS